MQPTRPIIHTFSGQHFEVAVCQMPESGVYAALIRARSGSGVAVFKGVIECTGEHLRELERLSKLAETLIDHLRHGRTFESWTFDPNNN